MLACTLATSDPVCPGKGITAVQLTELEEKLAAEEHGAPVLPFLAVQPVAAAAAAGQDQAEHQASDNEPAQQRLLCARSHVIPLLRCLASEAPVRQYLRHSVQGVVQQLLAVRALPKLTYLVTTAFQLSRHAAVQDEALQLPALLQLQRDSPVLLSFLKTQGWQQGVRLSAEAKDLLSAMMQVHAQALAHAQPC